MKTLVLATRNRGKVKEMREFLSGLPLNIVSLNDLPDLAPVDEDQATFAGNAKKKAEFVTRVCGEAALADDSGLEVDYLNGRPGVDSAFFAGPEAGDEANNSLLLEKLRSVPFNHRGAAFRCVLALAMPGRETLLVEGVCRGRIVESPQGERGFGYDPLFLYEPAGHTFAQMSLEEKNRVSHRSLALQKLRNLLADLLKSNS